MAKYTSEQKMVFYTASVRNSEVNGCVKFWLHFNRVTQFFNRVTLKGFLQKFYTPDVNECFVFWVYLW